MTITDISNENLLPGERHYNCSLTKFKDKYVFAYRKVTNEHSSVVVCKLTKGLKPIKSSNVELNFTKFATKARPYFEDPRLFVHKDVLYCSFVNSSSTYNWPRQGYCKLSDDFKVLDVYYPKHGDNYSMQRAELVPVIPGVFSSMHGFNGGIEKNWMFFSDGDKIKSVYMMQPHTIITLDKDLVTDIAMTSFPEIKWKWGNLSGGTAPVRVDDLYHVFFHSFVNKRKGGRVYSIGYYNFKAKYPYEVNYVRKTPLLIADEKDLNPMCSHACIFPCGAVYENGKWIVSYGFNDVSCKLAVFEKDEICV